MFCHLHNHTEYSLKNEIIYIFINENNIPYCSCGKCDKLVTWNKYKNCWNRFLQGHIKNRVIWNKGKKLPPLSQKHKDMISKSNKGKSSHLKGRKYLEIYGEERAIKEVLKRRKGRLDKKFTKETKQKIGEKKKNKTYIEMYGKEKAQEIVLKIKEKMKGNKYAKGKHWDLTKESKQKHKEERQKLLNDPIRKKIYIEKLSAALKGKLKSEEAKIKLSIICSDGRRSGNKNGNWNGGTSFLPYPPEFNLILKNKIRERDNNICQICGDIKTIYSQNGWAIHHIDYNKQNNKDENLIFLCERCHNKTNGAKNREKWILLFKEKMNAREVIAA
jgi:hypothetical protein